MKTVNILIVILTMVVIQVQSYDIKDIYTDNEKVMLSEYELHLKNEPVEDLALTHLISKHIKSASTQENSKGFHLLYRLSDPHKTYFDDIMIEYLLKEIATGMTYQDYKEKDSYFLRGIVVLGETRTDKSIDFLFQLMEPYENWSEPFQKWLKDNPDQTIWVTKIRQNVISSLLDPKDKKGEELIPIIEAKLNSFDSTQPGYSEMKSSIEFYKEYYAELKQDIDRFSLDRFDAPKQ